MAHERLETSMMSLEDSASQLEERLNSYKKTAKQAHAALVRGLKTLDADMQACIHRLRHLEAQEITVQNTNFRLRRSAGMSKYEDEVDREARARSDMFLEERSQGKLPYHVWDAVMFYLSTGLTVLGEARA